MKATIDVLFTLEQDLKGWSEEGKLNVLNKKELLIELFKKQFCELMDMNLGEINSLDVEISLDKLAENID